MRDAWIFPQPKIGSPLSKEERYAYYAYLIDLLYSKRGILIKQYLDGLYMPNISVEKYLAKVARALHALIENVTSNEIPSYGWLEVSSWIGTMITIIQSIFQHDPKIEKTECLQLCRELMRELLGSEFPPSWSENIREAYQGFIASLIKNGVSECKEANKLYCPALYTKWWNALLNDIVEAVYKHFPELWT
jgi:hypothetical protein